MERAARIIEQAAAGVNIEEEARSFVNESGESGSSELLHVIAASGAASSNVIIDLLRSLQLSPHKVAVLLWPWRDSLLSNGIVTEEVINGIHRSKFQSSTEIRTYDLEHEASEGYGKLKTTLLSNFPIKYNEILELTGAFRLEPYRVAAALVLRLGTDPENNGDSIISALRELRLSDQQLLGVVLMLLHSKYESVSAAIQVAVVELVKADMLSFDLVWNSLYPGDKTFDEYLEKWRSEQEKSVGSTGLSSLAMAPLLDDEGDDEEDNGDEVSEDSREAKDSNSENMEVDSVADKSQISETAESFYATPRMRQGDSLIELALTVLGKFTEHSLDMVLPVVLKNPGLTAAKSQFHETLCGKIATLLLRVPKKGLRGLSKDGDNEDEGDAADCSEKLSVVTKSPQSLEELITFTKFWQPLLEPASPQLLNAYAFIGGEVGLGSEYWRKFSALVVWEICGNDNPEAWEPIDKLSRSLHGSDVEHHLSQWYWQRPGSRADSSVKRAERDARSILKRLTDATADQQFTELVKVMHRDPMATLAVFISQIESYDKLGPLIVKNWRLLPQNSVMAFRIIVATEAADEAKPGRSGAFPSKWLLLLSKCFAQAFAAKSAVGDRMPLCIRISEVLRAQLTLGNYSRLPFLRELLVWGAGAVSQLHVSQGYIEYFLAGGALSVAARLQLCRLSAGKTEVPSPGNSSIRSLRKDTYGLTILLLRALSDVESRSAVPTAPKELGSLIDEVRETVQMYITTFYYVYPAPKSAASEPAITHSVEELVADYGVSVAAAFAVWRPSLGGLELLLSPKVDLNAVILQKNDSDISDSTALHLNETLYNVFWGLFGHDVSFDETPYLKNSMQQEMQAHKLRHSLVRQRLSAASGSWFEADTAQNAIQQFVTHCVLPRALWSPEDGLYVSRFIGLLKSLEIEAFSLNMLVDFLVSRVTLVAVISTATLGEIESFGVMLGDMLGSYLLDNPSLDSWHTCLVRALQQSLASSNSAPAAMQLLTRLLPVFPALRGHGAAIITALTPLSEDELVPDLQTAATSLLSQLKLREPTWVDLTSEIEPVATKWPILDSALTRSTTASSVAKAESKRPREDDERDQGRDRKSRRRGRSGANAGPHRKG